MLFASVTTANFKGTSSAKKAGGKRLKKESQVGERKLEECLIIWENIHCQKIYTYAMF